MNCTIHCGDCLEIMRKMPAGSVDLVLVDPPYGQTRNQWDTPLPQAELWSQYSRLIKPNGAIITFASGRYTADTTLAAGNLFRYTLVWHKTTPTGFLNANRQPLRAHEDIVVCYRHQPTYHPQKSSGHKRKISSAEHKRNSRKSTNYGDHALTAYDSTERYPTSVLTFATDKQKTEYHPTQKPIALLEWLIRTYTNEGDVVLDNCMGSGSTGVACVKTGREFIGIEIDPQLCEVARNRIAEVTPDG